METNLLRWAFAGAACVGMFGTITVADQAGPASVQRNDQADARWAPVAQLIAAATTSSFSPGGSRMIDRPEDRERYEDWQRHTRRTLRDLGHAFAELCPEDPRRWQWFVATVEHAPADLTAADRERWNAYFDSMWESMQASPVIPDRDKVSVFANGVFRPGFAEARRRAESGEVVDWETWERHVLEMGHRMPEYDGPNLRTAAGSLLRTLERWAPDRYEAFQASLRTSANAELVAMGGANAAVALARIRPMDIQFTAVDGREVDLRDYRGKVVLIDFWAATWCPWCTVEGKTLKALHDKYREAGFDIIGITHERRESDREFLLDYLEENGISWPQFFNGRLMNNPFAKRFGVLGLPEYFLLDQAGLLVWTRKTGGGIAKLEEEIRCRLSLPPIPENERIQTWVDVQRRAKEMAKARPELVTNEKETDGR